MHVLYTPFDLMIAPPEDAHPRPQRGRRTPDCTWKELPATLRDVDREALDRAWSEVVEAWEDDAQHERFLALGDATDTLPELARRYRSVRDLADGRAAAADRYLEAITARALGRLSSSPRDEPPRRSRLEWVALGLSVALAGAALWQMLRVM